MREQAICTESQVAPITCVITSYNNEATLRAAIESVVRQSLAVAEIIVADDCSCDGSQEMIKALAREIPNLFPIFRERNIGVAANRDLALRKASQPFVTHLDGDDLFAEHKIEKEWAVLDGDEQSVAYSYVAHIHEDCPWRMAVLDPSETVGGSITVTLARLLSRSGSIPRDMLLAKSLFLDAGGFDHKVKMYEDWQFKIRLAARGPRWLHSRTLGTLYFQRPGTLSKVGREEHARWKYHVVDSNIGLLVRVLGPETVASLLATAYGSKTFCEKLPLSNTLPCPNGIKGCKVLRLYSSHYRLKVASYLLSRVRALSYYGQIKRCLQNQSVRSPS